MAESASVTAWPTSGKAGEVCWRLAVCFVGLATCFVGVSSPRTYGLLRIPSPKTYAMLSNFFGEALGGEDLKTALESSLKKDWRNGAIQSSSEDVLYLCGTAIEEKSKDLRKLITSAFEKIWNCDTSDSLLRCGVVKGSMVTGCTLS